MSTIFQKHEDFLKRNEKKIKIKDGILFRGEINKDENGYWDREDDGIAAKNWEKQPRRYLYITKELPKDHKGWRDIRNEAGLDNEKDKKDLITSPFYKNYMYHLYGLESVEKQNKYVTFEKLSHEESVKFFQYDAALARINIGKNYGEKNTSDQRLNELISKNFSLLKEQIRILDADIIVCCGSSNDMPDLIYDTYPDADWQYYRGGIHFSKSLKKVLVHSYHLSCRKGYKVFYEDTIKPFAKFINKHPDFRAFR